MTVHIPSHRLREAEPEKETKRTKSVYTINGNLIGTQMTQIEQDDHRFGFNKEELM